MTRRGRSLARRALRAALAAASAAVLFAGGDARAQSSDVRMIRPNVLLLLDTSGSMEWRTGVSNSACFGADGGVCNQCSNGVSICAPTCPAAERYNRWTTAVEVLTGTIDNFSCVERPRNDASFFDYDLMYTVPYHEPRSNGVALWDPQARQQPNGILDVYAERVRFGLMTFDNDYCVGFTANYGQFSYGPDRGFRANGCMDNPVSVNVGSRRPSNDPVMDPVPGGLISFGPPEADAARLTAINDDIQAAITGRPRAAPLPPQVALRPFGGTPIAAQLEDAMHYWTTHPDVVDGSGGGRGDPYFRCRQRFNILITDGKPNMDFRPVCEGGNGQCPYATPDQTALRLATEGAGLPGARTFVIAFNASDPDTRAALEPIAINGGTTNVLYANDRTGLQTALSSVLDRIAAQTSTRTAPAFGMSAVGGRTNQSLYQFQSSFAVASGYPWEGVLERRRSECTGSPPVPVDRDIDPERDDFGLLLRRDRRAARGWGDRRLWTFVPAGATNVNDMRQSMRRVIGSSPRYVLDASIRPQLFGVNLPAERDALFAWLRGDPGTVRENRPLGDIFHSNPLVVTAPGVTLPDQTFSAFRQRALPVGGWRTNAVGARTVATREQVVYVGTNDGILHAFNADTGEEIWGFVPPYLTGAIRNMYPSNHQYGVDGTPVARDVIYTRSARALGDGNSWRSVLVVGLRQGGGAYVALDVTDPYEPSFLWQFTDRDLVNAYGIPAIGSVFTTWNAMEPTERAVAIIPGGAGAPDPACTATQNARPGQGDTRITNVAPNGGTPRNFIRCWQRTDGQYLYVVDMETGQLIRKFGPTRSPVVGSPSLYIGTAGAVSTRAYVGDADGGVWRLDMSDQNPANWRFGLAFDLFSGGTYDAGQPIVAPPVVSVDQNGDTLIAVGTGDPDLLEGRDLNRIAVYREAATTSMGGVVTAIQVQNVWEIVAGSNPTQNLYVGERLTGGLSLFNGVLYFGTFVPSNSSDACEMGFSRLWGVDQTVTTGRLPEGRLDLDGDPATTFDITRVTQDINGNGTTADDANSVLFGVGIVRRPTCVTTEDALDPYFGGVRQWVNGINGGDFRLVAQTGRGGSAVGGARTNVISRRLPAPITEPRVDAWAVVFE